MSNQTSEFILIVDDNSTNLSVLSQVLKQAGLKARVAMDGANAINIAQQHSPELILLDIQMPGMDGFETCIQLKANPATQIIPVIFMTALANTDSKVKGLSLGAVDYITKPFEEQEVLARVRVHLQLRQLTKALEQKNIQLYQSAEILEQRVIERTAALSQTLQELQQSQLQLIQQERMSTLGQLVAGVAHELNNPIGCIANNLTPMYEYIHTLTKTIEFYQQHCPEAKSHLEQIVESEDIEFALHDLPQLLNSMRLSTERIKDISISLRSFSRSDATKVLADLHDGLDSTLTILNHRLKAVGHRPQIEVIKHYGAIPKVECYPGLMNQVFMNILANAIDALEEALPAQPQIQIQTSLVGDQVCVQIKDNGLGMTVDNQQKIFHQFFTTKVVGKGTGLGLSIAHQVVQNKHGGRLTFTSNVGEGTEFSIFLPTATPHLEPVRFHDSN